MDAHVKIQNVNLYPWQADLMDLLKDCRATGKEFYVLSSRQKGKSYVLLLFMIIFSLEKKGDIIYLTPTNNLARKVFKEFVNVLFSSKLIKSANGQTLDITLQNGSNIYFRSAEMRDSLRGYTADLLIIDEAAMISDEIIDICLPMTNATNAPIVMVSTPKFRFGRFYEGYCRGLAKDNGRVQSFNFSDYDTTALLSKDRIEEYKKTMSKTKFINEIMGEFCDEGGDTFENITANVIEFPSDNYKQLTFGVDWGSGSDGDYTAVVSFNEFNEMVDCIYFNDITPTEQIEKIAKIIENHKDKKINKIVVEENSIGKVYYDLLRRRIPNYRIERFNTTNKSKNDLVDTLQIALQNGNIKILNDNELKIQLSAYAREVNAKTGTVTYNAPRGLHDDLVMATMIAYKSKNTKEYNFTVL